MKKAILPLLAILAISGSTAFADNTLKSCGGGNIALVDKFESGMYGEVTKYGKFIFVYGSLVKELQSKQLYPDQMIPGSSSSQGLYWNKAVQVSDNTFATSVRIANIDGPFFTYYFKDTGANSARLEIWQLLNSRPVQDGISPGDTLVYQHDFNDCR